MDSKEALKRTIEEKEKLEKVIEILKNKKVSIELLSKTKWVNQYNRVRHLFNYVNELTEEEYKLLKEVFGKCLNYH